MSRKGIFSSIAERTTKWNWDDAKEGVFVVTLSSFDSDITRAKLPDGTVITRLSKSDADGIRRSSYSTPLLFSLGDFAVKATLSASFDDAKKEALERFRRVILALRILGPGAPDLGMEGVAYQLAVTNSERHLSFFDLTGLGGGVSFGFGLRRYRIARRQVDELRKIYMGLVRTPAEAQVALRRFNIAYSRAMEEDRLIDFWVALESLFGKQGETQELTYKFAMRIAHFVGSSPEERGELFDELQDTYNVRSKVVHGSKSKKVTREAVRAAEEVTQSALRAALCRVVTDGIPPDPERLDAVAARGC